MGTTELPKAKNNPGGLTALLLVIIVVCLVVRVGSVLNHPETARSGLGPFGDSWAYHALGYNLAQGNGYSITDYGAAKGSRMDPAGTHVYEPAATRAPIYPYFLSLIYRFTGLSGSVSAGQLQETFHWVRLIQCALDTLTCLLVFCLTRLLARGSTPAALTASLLYALSPYHLYFSNAILTETLATFITVLAALTTTKAIIGNHTYAWALSGALWGILALCRPEYFPFGIVLAVILGAWHWRLGIPSGRVVILAIGIVAVMSPWIIRNFNTFGHPFVSTGGLGYSLFLGTFEGSAGFTGWSDVPEEFFPDQHERMMLVAMTEEYMQAMRRGSVDISSVDRKFLDFAVSRIVHDPFSSVLSWIRNAPRLWYQRQTPMYRDPEPQGFFALILLGTALIGFSISRKKCSIATAPAGMLIAFVTMLYAPLHIEPRYSVPALALVICFSGIGIAQLIHLAANTEWRRQRSYLG